MSGEPLFASSPKWPYGVAQHTVVRENLGNHGTILRRYRSALVNRLLFALLPSTSIAVSFFDRADQFTIQFYKYKKPARPLSACLVSVWISDCYVGCYVCT